MHPVPFDLFVFDNLGFIGLCFDHYLKTVGFIPVAGPGDYDCGNACCKLCIKNRGAYSYPLLTPALLDLVEA